MLQVFSTNSTKSDIYLETDGALLTKDLVG